MEYIRNCWNQNISSKEFAGGVGASDSVSMAHELLEICGSDSQPSLLFVEYLSALVENPVVCQEILGDVSKHNSDGVLRLIIEKGNVLFQKLEIGTELSARCALNALRVCLDSNTETVIIDGIQKLAESSIFSVIIASARVYFPAEVQQILPKFKEIVPESNFPSSIPFPMTLLRHALLSPIETKGVLFSRHELSSMVISNLIINTKVPSVLSFIEAHTFSHLYLHAISNFLANPTLELAYLVTNLLVRVFMKISNNSEQQLYVDSYSEEDLKNLIKTIKMSDDANPIFEHEDKENCDFLNKSTNFDTLLTYLTDISPHLSNNTIVDDAIRYPSLSSTLVERVSALMNVGGQLAISFAQQVTTHYEDFMMLLLRQHNFFNFLQIILNATISVEIADSIDEFNAYWFLSLSLIRHAWGLGWHTLRDEINVFIISQEDDLLKMFLEQLLHPNTLPSYSRVPSSDHYFYEIISTLSLWNKSTGKIEMPSKRKPLHIISLILTGLRHENPRSIIDDLLFLHPPDVPIINILFNQLLVKASPPARSFLTACSKPDYEVIMSVPPPSLTAVSPVLLEHFDTISRKNHVTNAYVVKITTVWNAWSDIFGFPSFCTELINKLIWKTGHAYVPDDASNLFQSVASVLVIQINRRDEDIDTALDTACKTIEYGVDSMAVCVGLAQFALVLICTCDGPWEKRFRMLLDRCLSLLDNSSNRKGEAEFFALSVIKTALYTPKLQSCIPETVLQALYKADDPRTMIDYFIAKSAVTE